MSDSKSCADLGKDAKSACVKSDAADVKSTSADKSGSYVSKSADITTASSTSEKSQCPYMKATTASSGDTDATIQTAAAKSADQTGTSCHGSKQPTTQTASDKDVITTTDKTAMIDKK
jgi:hypothetical protein